MKSSRTREPQGKDSKLNSVKYLKLLTLADIFYKYRQEITTLTVNMDLMMVILGMFRQAIKFKLTWMGPHSNLSF
jgi:Holliday junction resolvase-like predicted endonuclease